MCLCVYIYLKTQNQLNFSVKIKKRKCLRQHTHITSQFISSELEVQKFPGRSLISKFNDFAQTYPPLFIPLVIR